MKKKLSILLMFILMFIEQGFAQQSFSIIPPPLETVILKLPNKGYANWKEISRRIAENEGIVERIPVDQTKENWTELISIQYIDISTWPKDQIYAENIWKIYQEMIVSQNQGRVSFTLINKNRNNFIYEIIFHDSCKGKPPQHEIGSIFLTENMFHRISFTRKHIQMSAKERDKWIQILRNSASVASFEEAIKTPKELSFTNPYIDSLDLGPAFKGWTATLFYTMGNTPRGVAYVPPSYNEKYNGEDDTESLQVETIFGMGNRISIDELFKLEKKAICEMATKVNFEVLEKSPNEIIFRYSGFQNKSYHHVLVRCFLADQNYYSISYLRGVKKDLKEEEFMQWKYHLKAIKTRD